MHVKVFRAFTMREAIDSIKAELGPDAVILSTKDVRQAGALTRWFGRPLVEVTAAVERQAAQPEPPAPRTRADEPLPIRDLQPDPAVTPRARFHETLQRVAGDRVASTLTPPAKPTQEPMPVIKTKKNSTKPRLTRVKAELRSLHQQLLEAYPEDAIVTPKTVPVPMTMCYRDWVSRGLAPKTAVSFVQEIHDRLAQADRVDLEKLRTELRRLMAREVAQRFPLLVPDEDRKTALFVGPSGVGKTTAIAKLAAKYVTEQRRSVGLVTLDTYRASAVDQLRAYASALEIPMETALTTEDVAAALHRLSDVELVLIDTGGRSLFDPAYVADLRRLTRMDRYVETYLVLSATTREDDLFAWVQRFDECPVNRLLFTKLDEATGIGGLVALHRQTGIPLSYFSTGARVPHDLELAAPERLADLLIDGRFQERAQPPDQRSHVVGESLDLARERISA